MRMLVMLALVLAGAPAYAQSVDNDLPLARCDSYTGLARLFCVIGQASYREPKPCPQIGMDKIVPQSAACERGNDQPPNFGRRRSRDMGGGYEPEPYPE